MFLSVLFRRFGFASPWRLRLNRRLVDLNAGSTSRQITPRKRLMMRSLMSLALAVGCVALSSSGAALADDLKWERIKLDPVFRSEGVAAADVNRDGKMDVINGEAWYEAPSWKMHPIRKQIGRA